MRRDRTGDKKSVKNNNAYYTTMRGIIKLGIETPSFQRVLNFYYQRSYFRWIE